MGKDRIIVEFTDVELLLIHLALLAHKREMWADQYEGPTYGLNKQLSEKVLEILKQHDIKN